MEVTLKGSASELKTFFVTPGTLNPGVHVFGDPLPPPSPPPPPACVFSESECTQLHALCAALAAAESGSFVTTHEGTIRCINHPTSDATMVWTTTAADWGPGGWPP